MEEFVNVEEIHHAALIIPMVRFNTLPAEISLMMRAIKVSLLLRVVVAQVRVGVFAFRVDHVQKVIVCLHNFMEDVDIKRQLLHVLQVLHHFEAVRAADAIFSVIFGQTAGAPGVSAVDEDSGNSVAYIVN